MKTKIPKPLVLIVLDAWGVSQDYAGNAIGQSNTYALDSYITKYPTMTLHAHGESVGVGASELSTREINYQNLGLGRVDFSNKEDSLTELISKAGLRQLKIAETEKYTYLTYFFNGAQDKKYKFEDRELVCSKAVSSYLSSPEMSSAEITQKVIEYISDNLYDFMLINFAGADMLARTGDIEATTKAIEAIDNSIEKIVNASLAKDGVVLITASHGNAEEMLNMQSGQVDKNITDNPVPLILIGNEYDGRRLGWQDNVGDDLSTAQPQGALSDVAPTILNLLSIKKPESMTGRSLI